MLYGIFLDFAAEILAKYIYGKVIQFDITRNFTLDKESLHVTVCEINFA